LALAGFLAGYSGPTPRRLHTLDLRQYVARCTEHRMAVFGARRADIECFARDLESRGRARARIARRPTRRRSGAVGRGIPVDPAEEGAELTDVGAVAKDLLGDVAQTEAGLLL
jgi:hypothetical protein